MRHGIAGVDGNAGVLDSAPLSQVPTVVAQQPACLHQAGESTQEQLRRRQALTYARQVNSAQASVLSRARAYQALNALPVPQTAPAAFIAHLAVDANGYAFSIKDSADPCGFAYFSDQSGVIYAGEYIR